jgi:multiple sugar transport system ATP-binding protein
VKARLIAHGAGWAVLLESGEHLALPAARRIDGVANNRSIVLGVRPQHITLAGSLPLAPGVVRIAGKTELIQPTGTRTYVTARIGGAEMTAELGAHDLHEPHAQVDFAIDMNRCVLIDPETDRVL